MQGHVKRVVIPKKRTALNCMCGRRLHEIKRIVDRYRGLAVFPLPSRAFDGARIGDITTWIINDGGIQGVCLTTYRNYSKCQKWENLTNFPRVSLESPAVQLRSFGLVDGLTQLMATLSPCQVGSINLCWWRLWAVIQEEYNWEMIWAKAWRASRLNVEPGTAAWAVDPPAGPMAWCLDQAGLDTELWTQHCGHIQTNAGWKVGKRLLLTMKRCALLGWNPASSSEGRGGVVLWIEAGTQSKAPSEGRHSLQSAGMLRLVRVLILFSLFSLC